MKKLQTKFTEGDKGTNSLKNELQIPKESKQLIRNLNRKPTKMTKFGQTKLRLVNSKLILEKFVENDNIFALVTEGYHQF